MIDDPYVERRTLTFEQAEGAVPLPTQLASKEISSELRAILWHVMYNHLQKATEYSSMGGPGWINDPWKTIFQRHHVFHAHRMIDEYDNNPVTQAKEIKNIISKGEYYEVLGFLQFIMRDPRCPSNFREHVDMALVRGRAAYRILDRDTIVPISSKEEQETLVKAFTDVSANGFWGAKQHLRTAGEQLTLGNFAESTKESIHAVESVARVLESSGSLSGALTKLQGSAYIHPSLSQGFQKIYGYTSDEKGIRHPLLDNPSKVDEIDAIFMIGACASFISYLVNKARLAGTLSP